MSCTAPRDHTSQKTDLAIRSFMSLRLVEVAVTHDEIKIVAYDGPLVQRSQPAQTLGVEHDLTAPLLQEESVPVERAPNEIVPRGAEVDQIGRASCRERV